MYDDLPPATPDYVRALVAEGACLAFPNSILEVPIPLLDIRINNQREFIWATIQTPYGSERPIFGCVTYAAQTRLSYGSAFERPEGIPLCAIIDVREFKFPPHTERKLIRKAREHFQHLCEDPPYLAVWDSHFAMAVMSQHQGS